MSPGVEIGKFDLCLAIKKVQENAKKLWFDNNDQIDYRLKIIEIILNATKM